MPPRDGVRAGRAGAVQVVNDGQCIVLGVDGQTIGGYPKVAHVIAADLDRLGQLRPGQERGSTLARRKRRLDGKPPPMVR